MTFLSGKLMVISDFGGKKVLAGKNFLAGKKSFGGKKTMTREYKKGVEVLEPSVF
jgi:hypothetical protein